MEPSQVKEHASGVQCTFCLKSKIKGDRNSQLGNLAESAKFWPYGRGYQAGLFYGLSSRILSKIYSEPLMYALSPCEGPVESNFNFIQSLLSVL